MNTSPVRLFILLALFLNLNNSNKSFANIYSIDDLLPSGLSDSLSLKSLYDSAKYYSKLDPILSKSLLKKLISISKRINDGELHDYYAIYGNACAYNGELDEALFYYNKALSLDKQNHDTLEQIRIYNNLNYLYLLSNRLDLSLESAHKGLRLFEIMKQNNTLPSQIKEFGNRNAHWVESYFYYNIGLINAKVGNNREAYDNYRKALTAIRKSGDKYYEANTLNDLAAICRELKQYDQALNYCRRALAINREVDNDYGIGLNYQTLGDIYKEKKDFDNAKNAFDEGMHLLEKSDNENARSMTLLSMVALNIQSKDYHEARLNLNKCFEMINLSNNLNALREWYYLSFRLDSTEGNSIAALSHYIQYNELDKKIINVKQKQKIGEIQTDFALQQKEQENKLLKTENEVQQVRIEKAMMTIALLCGSFGLILIITFLFFRHQRLLTQHKIIELQQRNLNQQMNPHFVYNCLTSIQAYIFNNDSAKSLEYLSKFSKLMRKILEGSRNQYMSVHDETEMLALYLKLESIRYKGKFEYNISVDEKIDPIQFKIPALLIQPFVENSLWHGIQNKEGKGNIEISFALAEKSIFCSIEDNGVGREVAQEIKKSSSYADHHSLGTSITKGRMKLLKSLYGNKLDVRYIDLKDEHNQPAGTRVELYLPILN